MNTLMTDLGSWNPSQSPLAIEYTKSILDEVRDQAVAGYRRLSRGGVEVGGILYGIRDDAKVRILATQPITCEYKSGPSFILSEKDKVRLRDQLAQSESIDELRGLAVVGWYVSHPRGGIALSDRDLDVFNEFFPDIWNIALVMKPGDTIVRGGFFVREPRGSLNFAQSYQEFELSLPRNTEGKSAVRQIADQVSSSLAAQRDSVSDADAQRRRGGGRRDIAEMPLHPPGRGQDVPRPFVSSAAATAAAFAAAPAPLPPAGVDPEQPSQPWSIAVARPRSTILAQRPRQGERSRRLKWRWLVMWAMFIVAVVAGSYVYREFTTPAPLGLHVSEMDGDLTVQWDPTSRSVQWADQGMLEIRAADRLKREIVLDKQQLSKGTYQFEGSDGDTSIRLAITGKIGFHAAESTRYVARVMQEAPNAKPVDIRDRRKLQVEVIRLREELDKAHDRIKELESLLYNR
jgi:proteasome lid subunit RPN8/RPN11